MESRAKPHRYTSIATHAKRAIFGGTFNPIHCAHLEIAAIAQQLDLAEIIWVPTAAPHYKPNVVALEHRSAMVAAAIAPYPQFRLVRLPQQFAIETFTTLTAQQPDSQWFWLIGLDAFTTLPRWMGRGQLAAGCTWLVAPRGEPSAVQPQAQQVAKQLSAEGTPLRWQLLDRSPRPISSSLVRQRCRANLSIDHLVPPAVQAYIQQQGLYRS